jgi:glycosyltransferase involved in cell wall biosynthesis
VRLVVTTECRFERTPDGATWTDAGPSYEFWTRYLSVFDEVRVVARTKRTGRAGDGAVRVDGPGVAVWPVPYYVGPVQYAGRWAAVRRAVRAAAADDDAVILRIPSPMSGFLAARRRRRGRPYAVEAVGDPADVLAAGVIDHPLRPLLRYRAVAVMRRLCREAAAVAYVTGSTLQRRYPRRPGAPTASYSSVDLPDDAFVRRPRPPAGPASRLISVGSLEQLYKGVDTLLLSLSRLVEDGVDARLVHVGGGRFRPELERLAAALRLADRVTFVGNVPAGAAVRRFLDEADLCVQPSRTEGVPRALIEAMARALPAIGTTVGGIPELLPAEFLAPPDDPATLAQRIRALLHDPSRMAAASAANLARARDFHAETLADRRDAFYRAVRDTTAGDRAGRTAGSPR